MIIKFDKTKVQVLGRRKKEKNFEFRHSGTIFMPILAYEQEQP